MSQNQHSELLSKAFDRDPFLEPLLYLKKDHGLGDQLTHILVLSSTIPGTP